MAFDRQHTGFVIIRIFIGLFFLGEGLHKLRWFSDPSILANIFSNWLKNVEPGSLSHRYIAEIALPGVWVFARLVPLGEISTGLALIAGVYTSVVASVALFMVLNYTLASGAIFRSDILTNGNVLPMIGSTLGLAIGGLPRRFRQSKTSEKRPPR